MSEFPKHLEQKNNFEEVIKLASIFNAENIEKIELTIEKRRHIFSNDKPETVFNSCVTLANSSSRLYHRIIGNSVQDLVKKTEAFIKTIE